MDISPCQLCPRKCGALRRQGRTGWCGSNDAVRVFRWGPHFGEEPPLTGAGGSGCIFFSRCTMKCLYCQNSPWSWKGEGEDITTARLAEIMRQLAETDNCSNWNLVSPTPYLPFIREAAHDLSKEGVRLPFVWNTSGYERVETLREYRDLCDIALIDMRYSADSTAIAASCAPGYVQANREAIEYLYSVLGPLDSEEPGKAHKGMIIRILVLPGHHNEALENLAWLAAKGFTNLHIAVMSQFTPSYKALETPPFDRKITEEEYSEVTEAAADFGFEKGWIQGFQSADSESLLGENMASGHGTTS